MPPLSPPEKCGKMTMREDDKEERLAPLDVQNKVLSRIGIERGEIERV